MKTKAAFSSLLGLTLITSLLASSTAQAQMRTNIASKKPVATSRLKTKVQTADTAEKKESPFNLNISETYYGKLNNEENYLENWITAGFKAAENVSITLETGFDAYVEKQEKNAAADLEGNIYLSGIEIAKDLSFTTGLIGVLATSRGSRNNNMTGAFGGRGNFALKIGTVSLGLDNNFYQLAYKAAPIATPEEEQTLEGDEKRFYGNEYTRATTVLSSGIPIGPIKFKNDVRYRQSIPYEGEETRTMRYRTRISHDIFEGLSITGGASWSQKLTDPKRETFFSPKNRTWFLTLSIDA